MKKNLSDKTAIVTGATRGIGAAISRELLAHGCNVIITGTSERCESKGKNANSRYLQLDFLDIKSIKKFIDLINKMARIDILINNAGINKIEPIYEINDENWKKILQVNLTGPMCLSKEISRKMVKKHRGKILNISSIFGTIAREKRDSYSASKAGLLGLTRAMALDLAPYGILVNALCPGYTDTKLTRTVLSKNEIFELSKQIPLGRLAKVEEIAKAAVFLCSDDNTYITGQTITIDGGISIK